MAFLAPNLLSSHSAAQATRESRAITRLLHEARLRRMKTLEAFEFDRSGVSAGQLRALAEGDYVTKAEPILLVCEAESATYRSSPYAYWKAKTF